MQSQRQTEVWTLLERAVITSFSDYIILWLFLFYFKLLHHYFKINYFDLYCNAYRYFLVIDYFFYVFNWVDLMFFGDLMITQYSMFEGNYVAADVHDESEC